MVCARGPMTVASWLAGISPLMMGLAENPEGVSKLLEIVTTSIIQLAARPVGHTAPAGRDHAAG